MNRTLTTFFEGIAANGNQQVDDCKVPLWRNEAQPFWCIDEFRRFQRVSPRGSAAIESVQ